MRECLLPENKMSIHPQVAVLLERVARSRLPPYQDVPPAVARRLYHDTRVATSPPAPEMGSVSLALVPGPCGPIPLRVYKPVGAAKGEILPALVYFHGGGWVIGDLDTHDIVCRELANGSRCVVVSVEYRLAPEAQFPAAVDDCVAATRYISTHATEFGADPKRIAVGGDSAGGNLAAVVCIDARDVKTPMPCFQLLIYPATDQRSGHPSHARNAEGYLLTRKGMNYFRGHYLPNEVDWLDWRASPLLATGLAGLPPAYVITAGYDPLVDEGRAYAERLEGEGVEVKYREYPDMVHGFLLMGGVLDTAREAVAGCCAALRAAFEAQ